MLKRVLAFFIVGASTKLNAEGISNCLSVIRTYEEEGGAIVIIPSRANDAMPHVLWAKKIPEFEAEHFRPDVYPSVFDWRIWYRVIRFKGRRVRETLSIPRPPALGPHNRRKDDP